MSISIRTAQPDDWEIIQELNHQVFLNDIDNDPDMDQNWPYTEIGIKYYHDLADGKYGHCLVAESDGKIVGYVALGFKTYDYRKSKYVEVENIGVDQLYRSQGVGKLLMDRATEWAKSRVMDRLIVQACWGNQSAIKFYKNNGFIEMALELEKKL